LIRADDRYWWLPMSMEDDLPMIAEESAGGDGVPIAHGG